MKRMASGGFTIVESMIVLGVTGVLFVSLAAMMSGQQSKARFKASMSDITTQIQSQINEVATGYYPNMANFSCVMSGGAVQVSGGTKAQGTNKDCTFLGRALMYASLPATDPQQLRVQTLVGLRKTSLSREPLTLSEAGTRPLAPGNAFNLGWLDLSETRALAHGTEVIWMRSLNGGGPGIPQRISGIAIVAAPNQQVAYSLNGVAESGTVIPSIIPIPNSGSPLSPGLSPKDGVDEIVRAMGLATSTASATQGPVEICFKSGTTAQSGLVTIGRNNSTTAVDLTIYNTADCS